MNRPYQSWIDWLKVLGMAVIIFGHSGGHALIPDVFNPINAKQLGVAFFVFITAFTLAGEKRSAAHAVFNRFFDVFVLGVLLTLFLSVVQWFRIGDVNESNYLPFVFGLNVVWENAFPANPTTWYVGTYFHLLVAWALVLRFLPCRPAVFAGLLVVEIGVRSVLMGKENDFNAYMVLTSWLTVFFIGTWLGRRTGGDAGRILRSGAVGDLSATGTPVTSGGLVWRPLLRRTLLVMAIGLLMAGWLAMVTTLDVTKSNPFGRIPAGGDVTTALVSSAAVTVEYAAYTLLIFAFFLGLPANRLVRFLSQNTLFVFLAHMPFRDLVTPYYYPLLPGGWVRQIANFFVLFVMLACVSHLLRKGLRLESLKRQIGRRFFRDHDNRASDLVVAAESPIAPRP